MAIASSIVCAPKQNLPYPKLRRVIGDPGCASLTQPVIVLCDNYGRGTVVYTEHPNYTIGMSFPLKDNQAEDWTGTVAISNGRSD
jgi:hypothetical protein